jgi:hypothetical protein
MKPYEQPSTIGRDIKKKNTSNWEIPEELAPKTKTDDDDREGLNRLTGVKAYLWIPNVRLHPCKLLK